LFVYSRTINFSAIWRVGLLKKILLRYYWARIGHIYLMSNSSLFSNRGPLGSGGATIGKSIFTCVYIKKIFSRTSRPISIKWWSLFLFFFRWVPLSRNNSYLHENFLTYCRFKLVQIMVPEGKGVKLELTLCLLKWFRCL
jgi:hypothetical protein